MGTGVLSNETLKNVMNIIQNTPGDFAEIGVFRGATFKRLILFAQLLQKKAHAFDSFIGMNTPSTADGNQYDKGKFDIGGVEAFRKLMLTENLNEDFFSLWDGYVPHCLNKCPVNTFSFIYIDLDHHDPTKLTIEWAWPRLAKGGVMGFDDYFPGRKELASPPIDNFLISKQGEYEKVSFNNNQIFIRKL